jgi:hypothetical protein
MIAIMAVNPEPDEGDACPLGVICVIVVFVCGFAAMATISFSAGLGMITSLAAFEVTKQGRAASS